MAHLLVLQPQSFSACPAGAELTERRNARLVQQSTRRGTITFCIFCISWASSFRDFFTSGFFLLILSLNQGGCLQKEEEGEAERRKIMRGSKRLAQTGAVQG